MNRSQQFVLATAALVLGTSTLGAQSVPKESYDFNYIGQPLSDPMLQKAKETFVLFGCSYCHGLNLVSRGEATDLMHSKLVGSDTDGKVIGALLRAGIPQTPALSPMPQFSDLSDQQIGHLARWIHYARAQGRFKELTEAKDPPPGNIAAGKAYFDEKCGSCHSASGDMAGIGSKHSGPELKALFLKPKMMDELRSWKIDQLHDANKAAARQQHQRLLENYSADDAANVTAYLATLK
jgi:mono/diheme cytochrome c family protein